MRPRSTLKWLRLSLVFETLGLECQVLTRVQQGALKAAHKEKGKKGKPNETPALQVTEELPEASPREPSKKLREKRRKGGGALRRKGSRRNVLKRRASRVKAAEGTNGAPKKSSQKKAGVYAWFQCPPTFVNLTLMLRSCRGLSSKPRRRMEMPRIQVKRRLGFQCPSTFVSPTFDCRGVSSTPQRPLNSSSLCATSTRSSLEPAR